MSTRLSPTPLPPVLSCTGSVAWFAAAEMEGINLSSVTNPEFQRIVTEELLGTRASNRSKQEVIQMGEVGRYIRQGSE